MQHQGVRWMLVAVSLLLAVVTNLPRGLFVRRRPRRVLIVYRPARDPRTDGERETPVAAGPERTRPNPLAASDVRRRDDQADAA